MSAVTTPRLLRGGPSLDEHLAAHGPLRAGRELIDACERAGLRGRGGALFPTAVKLRTVAAHRGRRIVVVNAAEGEPMSAKDRVLLERAPHLVLDGALAAARAVGAREVIVAVAASASRAGAAVTRALQERGNRSVRLAAVPDAFLAGEETALLQALARRAARPVLTPPWPAERGLGRRPTLVQNPETLAHLALIARHGPEWFRALGTERHPGSTLVTVAGCVRRPGVYEIDVGTDLAGVVGAAGGVTEPVRAVLTGGYHGTWVEGARAPGVRLDAESLAAAGLRMGAGAIVLLPASACPVAETARVVAWLASQTAGQCGPCVHGLPAIAAQLEAIRHGRADRLAIARLDRWSAQVAGRGACHHPDGTVEFVGTALEVFEAEVEMHRRFGPCEQCAAAAVLPTPAQERLAA